MTNMIRSPRPDESGPFEVGMVKCDHSHNGRVSERLTYCSACHGFGWRLVPIVRGDDECDVPDLTVDDLHQQIGIMPNCTSQPGKPMTATEAAGGAGAKDGETFLRDALDIGTRAMRERAREIAAKKDGAK
ncbi:MAG: hypothetical protein IMZ62_12720 [Chloroflexi bacterium]|nr:hypothetical protein [Chloroflexota bacterium]MBE3117518.1 hypothetical protein [Candidatus Atribacteria bacterium]